MLTTEEIRRRTTYHPPTDAAAIQRVMVRGTIQHAMFNMNTNVPDGREKAVVMTKLEEALFWANAGIARNLSPESSE